ncbi:MAG TPA: hypothetical protein VJH92_02465 [Candidatus Nanoarchaeia archaeon]|nr:hypothetical protein [Candidatus Nanoarchaeia archaeon]
MEIFRKFKRCNLLEKGVAAFGTLGGLAIVPGTIYRLNAYPSVNSEDFATSAFVYVGWGIGMAVATAASTFIFSSAGIGLANNMKKAREEREYENKERKLKHIVLDARDKAIRNSVKPYNHFF